MYQPYPSSGQPTKPPRPPAPAPVQTAVTDRGGFFQTQLVLPKGTPAGPHTLIAVGTGGRKATAILHVS